MEFNDYKLMFEMLEEAIEERLNFYQNQDGKINRTRYELLKEVQEIVFSTHKGAV
jgi:hypothetical protein